MLYVFCSQGGDECTDGLFPAAGLIAGDRWKLYGTTSYGGSRLRHDEGTVFKITPGGKLTTLYNFCSAERMPGWRGPHGVFVEGSDRNFYGATRVAGHTTTARVFKITSERQADDALQLLRPRRPNARTE